MRLYRTMLCREGQWTPDGRMVARGAIAWSLPRPVMHPIDEEGRFVPEPLPVGRVVYMRRTTRSEIDAHLEVSDDIAPGLIASFSLSEVDTEQRRHGLLRRQGIVIRDGLLMGVDLMPPGPGQILDWGHLELLGDAL